MNKSLSIVFSFDNLDQLLMTELLIKSIKNFDGKFIFNISEEIKNDEKIIVLKKKYNIIINEFKKGELPGKFYWYFTPFSIESDYLLFLDNDVILKDIDLNDFIEKYKRKLKSKSIIGVKSHVWRLKNKRLIIKSFRKNWFQYISRINKYVNSGVILMNVKLFKKRFTEDIISQNFSDYKKQIWDLGGPMMDQEFLSIYFWEEISFINQKYNLRFNNNFLLWINKNSKEKIYHYNIWRIVDGKKIKYNIDYEKYNLKMKYNEKKFIEFWSSNGKKVKKSTINSIHELFEILYNQ